MVVVVVLPLLLGPPLLRGRSRGSRSSPFLASRVFYFQKITRFLHSLEYSQIANFPLILRCLFGVCSYRLLILLGFLFGTLAAMYICMTRKTLKLTLILTNLTQMGTREFLLQNPCRQEALLDYTD